jgi:hypothetical protein
MARCSSRCLDGDFFGDVMKGIQKYVVSTTLASTSL